MPYCYILSPARQPAGPALPLTLPVIPERPGQAHLSGRLNMDEHFDNNTWRIRQPNQHARGCALITCGRSV